MKRQASYVILQLTVGVCQALDVSEEFSLSQYSVLQKDGEEVTVTHTHTHTRHTHIYIYVIYILRYDLRYVCMDIFIYIYKRIRIKKNTHDI